MTAFRGEAARQPLFGTPNLRDNTQRAFGSKEALHKAEFKEVRLGNYRADAPQLLRIMTQPSNVEHLAIVRPDWTEDDVIEYFESRPKHHLIVATNTKDEAIGMTIVEETGPDLNYVSLGKLAVDEEYKGQGVATKILKKAHAFIFADEKDGGLNSEGRPINHIQLAVIEGPAGYKIAEHLFEGEGYEKQGEVIEGRTNRWSRSHNKLVISKVQLFILQESNYRSTHYKETHDPNYLRREVKELKEVSKRHEEEWNERVKRERIEKLFRPKANSGDL